MKQAILLITVLFFFVCKPQAQTVTDIDGNLYHTVTIGTQVWMVENLKTTRYNDGTGIQMVIDSSAWGHASKPGYCWYSNTAVYKDIFGALYNWFAVNTGKLAPAGWHVPADAEWSTLTDFLGGESSAGGKLKAVGTIEIGTSYWYTPNSGATNTSGFSALAGGARELDGSFNYMFSYGLWWSATSANNDFSLFRRLSYNYPDVQRGNINKQDGLSVRCVKNTGQGTEDFDHAELLRIFPNPAVDLITIECAERQSLEITISNLFGELLCQKKVNCTSDKIELRTLPKGMYIIHVTGPDWQLQRKLIKD